MLINLETAGKILHKASDLTVLTAHLINSGIQTTNKHIYSANKAIYIASSLQYTISSVKNTEHVEFISLTYIVAVQSLTCNNSFLIRKKWVRY